MLTMKQWKKAIFALCLLGTTFVVCSCNTNSPLFQQIMKKVMVEKAREKGVVDMVAWVALAAVRDSSLSLYLEMQTRAA